MFNTACASASFTAGTTATGAASSVVLQGGIINDQNLSGRKTWIVEDWGDAGAVRSDSSNIDGSFSKFPRCSGAAGHASQESSGDASQESSETQENGSCSVDSRPRENYEEER